MKISVVIPVYNSATIISQTVDKTINELKKLGVKFEIILVNDGSTDNSWQVWTDQWAFQEIQLLLARRTCWQVWTDQWAFQVDDILANEHGIQRAIRRREYGYY